MKLSSIASPPHKRFSVGCGSPFMRLAEHLTALRACCKQMSSWSVKTRRAPSRHSKDARVYGHTTTVMHTISTPASLIHPCASVPRLSDPPPPSHLQLFASNASSRPTSTPSSYRNPPTPSPTPTNPAPRSSGGYPYANPSLSGLHVSQTPQPQPVQPVQPKPIPPPRPSPEQVRGQKEKALTLKLQVRCGVVFVSYLVYQ